MKKDYRIKVRQNLRFLRGYLAMFIPVALVLGGVLLTIFLSEVKSEIRIIRAGEQNTISHLREMIGSDFTDIVSDLFLLAQKYDLKIKADNQTRNDTNLQHEFEAFSKFKKVYDQIRYLDKSGMEIIRVNYNSGTPEVVPRAKLQNKGGRYYFTDAFKLNEGEVFVSPLDLNIEQGQIEQPLKPMIRFGTPIFNAQKQKSGIILLNYFGAQMLSRLDAFSKLTKGYALLLNKDGYWLKGPNPNEEWGFMYDDRSEIKFAASFPDLWNVILSREAGQIETAKGLFTFATIYPLKEGLQSSTGSGKAYGESNRKIATDEYFWKIATHVEASVLNTFKQRIAAKLVLLYLGLISILAVGCWLITRARIQRLRDEEAILKYTKELKNNHAELEAAHKKLKATQSQILQQEKMASIGQLAAGVAHEINTPMGFITSNLCTLKRYLERYIGFIGKQAQVLNSLGAESQVEADKKKLKIDFLMDDTNELLSESLAGAAQVTEIVQNLKKFSRVDEASTAYANINDCIESTLKIICNELKHKATVHKEYGELSLTLCSPQELNQVFLNILINASHSFQEQGEITIKTWQENNNIMVNIADNGSGIQADKIDRIFEPFFTTKEVGKGTGLGLSICYDIVKKHGGKITVESKVGIGTTFTIAIPVTAMAVDEQ